MIGAVQLVVRLTDQPVRNPVVRRGDVLGAWVTRNVTGTKVSAFAYYDYFRTYDGFESNYVVLIHDDISLLQSRSFVLNRMLDGRYRYALDLDALLPQVLAIEYPARSGLTAPQTWRVPKTLSVSTVLLDREAP